LKRAKQRAHLGGKSIVRFARKALESGLGFKNANGNMLGYIKKTYAKHGNANNIKVYGHEVYVFRNKILLTIIDLPDSLKSEWRDYKNEYLQFNTNRTTN